MRFATIARRILVLMAERLQSAVGAIAKAKKPKVLVIAGTTSVGKTDLSLELVGRLNGEVISADSVQVYKHLDIGSAKVEAEICSRVPHHLLDVASIREPFSAGDYYTLAARALQDIISRGRVPLVVGGAGLYIRTLMQGPTGSPPSTAESKAMVDAMVEQDGGDWESSLARLESLDPEYAASLSPNDWYRLKRALEICTLSGRTVTSYKKVMDPESCPYEFKCLFLSSPRVQLFQRIDARCETIVEQGLFPEVISLVRKEGLRLESQAGKSVGYRQALEYLRSVWGFLSNSEATAYSLQVPRGELRKTFLEFLFAYQSKTRQLAHSQLVWFKKEAGFQWLNMAPGGQRLPLPALADTVAQWFTGDTPLPPEWEGQGLMELSDDEKQMLKEYLAKHTKPTLFSDTNKIDSILQQIETCLLRT